MGKRKLKQVTWSMYFEIDPEIDRDMWKVLHLCDRKKPEAFCEWATDNYYNWHGFLSRKSLREVLPFVFFAFPEVKEIEVYKDKTVGCFTDVELRERITREEVL